MTLGPEDASLEEGGSWVPRREEDDEYVPLINVHCPNCGAYVAELPEDEPGQIECPNCEEEFDLG